MNNNYPLISQSTIPIRWIDVDAYGIVNNANFIVYASEARIQSFSKDFTESTLQYIVTDLQINYKKSFYYPGSIILEQHLKELGRTYMVFYYAYYLAGDAHKTLYAECTTKVACYDPQKQRVIRIPQHFRARLINSTP